MTRCVYVKIYALKPFEADIGAISPTKELSTLSGVPTADGRGTSGRVVFAPSATSVKSDTAM